MAGVAGDAVCGVAKVQGVWHRLPVVAVLVVAAQLVVVARHQPLEQPVVQVHLDLPGRGPPPEGDEDDGGEDGRESAGSQGLHEFLLRGKRDISALVEVHARGERFRMANI